jgi:lysophospholipase L1-like esterase
MFSQGLLLVVLLLGMSCIDHPLQDAKVRYVALGDSYTICEGAAENESWPVAHLNETGIKTELVANPSRTGWTTQNLIDRELPVFDKSSATFATLLIGVNDWVQGVDEKTFRKNLIYIIDHVQSKLPDKKKLVLITIPDFGVTPSGSAYSGGRDINGGISAFNKIITEEAGKRGLKTVDIFPVSKEMKNDLSLVANDKLHPSAKEYAVWEKMILPVVKEVLKK